MDNQYLERVVDLTDPGRNIIYNMSHEQAVNAVRTGDAEEVRKIDGQFAIVSVDGKTVLACRRIRRRR